MGSGVLSWRQAVELADALTRLGDGRHVFEARDVGARACVEVLDARGRIVGRLA